MSMKRNIIFICVFFAVLGVGGLITSYYVLSPFWQSCLVSFSIALIQLVLGMIIINIYLDNKSKKSVANAILYSSEQLIADYHNKFLEFLWKEFGQKKWEEIINTYVDGNGAPEKIAFQDQNKVFTVIKTNYEEIINLLLLAAKQVEEVSKSGILTFDADMHSHAWAAKDAARKFLEIDINKSDINITKVFEYCVDFDIYTQLLRMDLYRIANKK